MPSFSRHSLPAMPARRGFAIVAAACAGWLLAGVSPALAAFPGANGRIAFTSAIESVGDEDLWTMNPDGSARVNLTPGWTGNDGFPNWRADGRKLVFASNTERPSNPVVEAFGEPDLELYTMNADGSHVRQLTFNEVDDDDPAWSPDRKRVAFQRDVNPAVGPDNRDWDIFSMKVAGGRPRNLTDNPAQDGSPNWSPDGRRIVFDSSRDAAAGTPEENIEIYTMRSDGSRVRRLTYSEGFEGQPNWSPDGRRISFQGYRDDHLEIWTMRADGRHQRQVTRGADAFGSAWAPDGRLIAHSSFDTPDIFTVRLDGSGSLNLTDDPAAFDFAPDWQPLPRKRH